MKPVRAEKAAVAVAVVAVVVAVAAATAAAVVVAVTAGAVAAATRAGSFKKGRKGEEEKRRLSLCYFESDIFSFEIIKTNSLHFSLSPFLPSLLNSAVKICQRNNYFINRRRAVMASGTP